MGRGNFVGGVAGSRKFIAFLPWRVNNVLTPHQPFLARPDMENISELSKLKAMIHYIADVVPRHNLGKVKLNKILWFSDREMYLKHGRTISGDTYRRYPLGPVSANIIPAIESLQEEKKLIVRKIRHYTFEGYEYTSCSKPDTSTLNSDELAIIDRQIAWISPRSANDVSDISHDATWDMYENGEEIPMYSVLAARTREVTAADIAWAMSRD